MAKRFVLEGEWRGYSSSQDHVCHRQVITEQRAKRLAGYRQIVFTDGTALTLRVRPAKLREKVTERNSYGSLINDCVHYDIWTVQGLVDAHKARDEERKAKLSANL